MADLMEQIDMTESSPPTACVWPTCANTRTRFPDLPPDATPLCDIHLAVAKVLADRRQAEQLASMGLPTARPDQPEPQAQDRPKPTDGTVYFVQVGGHIKIGWTTSLQRRMRSYPPGSHLLAAHEGTRKEEAALHRRFAAHRTHGREWYPLAADLVRHIDRVKAEHGDPPTVDFAGKPVSVPTPHRDKPAVRPKARVRHRA